MVYDIIHGLTTFGLKFRSLACTLYFNWTTYTVRPQLKMNCKTSINVSETREIKIKLTERLVWSDVDILMNRLHGLGTDDLRDIANRSEVFVLI